jgi:tetratricopeptide (TPR) repeat protein
MTLLKEAYDIAPANLEVNNNLGKLYMTKELYTQAIDFFKKAMDKKTDTPTIRFNLALAYIATNQKDLAKTVLQDLIKLDAQYWDAYYRLGGVLYDLGDPDSGKKVYQDLLARNPSYPKKDEIQGIIAK